MKSLKWRLVALILAVAAVSSRAQDDVPELQLQILHINDNHARFSPADSYMGPCPAGSEAACFGGFARQATAIKAAQAAATEQGIDTLVLHAGDQYTGTLWDVVYTRQGIQKAPAYLQELGVQAFTLGNHEFDTNTTNLAQFIGNASTIGDAPFPVLSCNLDTTASPQLAPLVKRFTVVELPISGVKVGVVGLTTVETPLISTPAPELKFLGYNDSLPGCVADAKKAGAQLIIALTHIGYDQDKQLAESAAASGVDLIVGAHTHTLLYGEPAPAGQPQLASTPPPILVTPRVVNESSTPLGPYPTLAVNQAGDKTIPIVTASWGSRYLGVLNTTWDLGAGELLEASGAPLLLGGANSSNPVPDDPAVAAQLAKDAAALEAYSKQIVGTTAVYLDGDFETVRSRESNLADAECASWANYVKTETRLLDAFPGRPVACIITGGTIRSSIQVGDVTQEEVIDVAPYGNTLVVKRVDAPTLVAALNLGLSGFNATGAGSGKFPQVGGLRYGFDPAAANASARLRGAQLVLPDGSLTPLAPYQGEVLLLVDSYIAGGGDSYGMIGSAETLSQTSELVDALLSSYIAVNSPVNLTADGRIVNCQQNASNPLCVGGGPAPAPAPAVGAAAAASPHPTVLLLLCLLAASVIT